MLGSTHYGACGPYAIEAEKQGFFALVNCSVISHYFIREKNRDGAGVFKYLILPLIGAILCIALWFTIDKSAKILGGIWLVIGFVVLVIMTKGFRVKPKEIDLSEE